MRTTKAELLSDPHMQMVPSERTAIHEQITNSYSTRRQRPATFAPVTTEALSPETEKRLPESVAVDLDSEVDAAIAACGGDMRATIRALLVANRFLEQEVERTTAAVSLGYARGMITPMVARTQGGVSQGERDG